MKILISYTKNATVARARAMYGKRLSENDYKELAGKKSVSEVAEYLKKNTHYANALSSVNTASVHRGYLESVIRRYSFDRYINICDFQQLRNERFYNYLIVLSEIREILSVILHMNAESSEEYISGMPAYLIHKTDIDLIQLAKARSMKELLSVLRHTPYFNVLRDINVDDRGHVDYLNCEIKLRTYYYNWLISTVKKDFSKPAENELLELIGTQIDIINIINAYRMKKYYGLSSAEIEKRSLPIYRKLSARKQKELYSHENAEEFLSAFLKTYYGRALNLEDEKYFELEMDRLESIKARRALSFSQNAAVSVYSLVYIFDIEVKNIITIIEGIRYRRSSENILSMIVAT